MMQITFWQNMPSHHLAPIQRELAAMPNIKVRVFFAKNISEARLKMGWSLPEFGKAETDIIDGNFQKLTKLASTSKGINFIGGLGGRFNNIILDNLPKETDNLTGLLLERGIYLGNLKDRLRPWYHRVILYKLKAKFDFIFAFGELGVDYYQKLGVPTDKIFPFLYVCDHQQTTITVKEHAPIRLIYIGSLSHRKGPDLIPEALIALNHYNWELTVIGKGALGSLMRDQFEKANLSDQVKWVDQVPSDQIEALLSEQDICLVPSRHDGWGMSVSEAIEAGLCTVTTPTVGAKDLILTTNAGTVTSDITSMALVEALEPYFQDTKKIVSAKQIAINIRHQFRGNQIAQYLLAVLKHTAGKSPSPLAPWEEVAANMTKLVAKT